MYSMSIQLEKNVEKIDEAILSTVMPIKPSSMVPFLSFPYGHCHENHQENLHMYQNTSNITKSYEPNNFIKQRNHGIDQKNKTEMYMLKGLKNRYWRSE